jgi:transposase-like protein
VEINETEACMQRHSEEEKAWLVEEWEQSGKTKGAFARELGLNVQTFTSWTRKRTGEQGFVELAAPTEEGSCGTALVTAAEEALIGRELRVERGDLAIRLPRGATRAELAAALQALRALP